MEKFTINFTNYKLVQFAFREISPPYIPSSGSDVKIYTSRARDIRNSNISPDSESEIYSARSSFVRLYVALQDTFDSYGWVTRFSTPLRETIVRFSSVSDELSLRASARERERESRSIPVRTYAYNDTGQIFKITVSDSGIAQRARLK